ncbi:MAG: hypothetical protein JXK93_11405, partial [Sphaerochaetaceae bacterium]|nr:hypothetical protein [Sphaerochaetaceae bacterium]
IQDRTSYEVCVSTSFSRVSALVFWFDPHQASRFSGTPVPEALCRGSAPTGSTTLPGDAQGSRRCNL